MTSNDPETPRFVLTLKGEVVSEVMVQPKRIRFKELKPSEKATREVSIKLRDPNKAKVTSVTIEDSRFTLNQSGSDPDKGDTYEVVFLGSPEMGKIMTTMRIDVDGTDKPSIDIPIVARVSGNLRYQKRLFFTKRKGTYSPKRIMITTRDQTPLHVKKVVDEDNLLNIEILNDNASTVNILAKLADPDAAGDPNAEHKLLVHTNNKDQPIAQINYRIGDGDVSKFMRSRLNRKEKRDRGKERKTGAESR